MRWWGRRGSVQVTSSDEWDSRLRQDRGEEEGKKTGRVQRGERVGITIAIMFLAVARCTGSP